MALQTDPTAFSITALLADQVALVARSQKLPPGAASLLLRELMTGPLGRRRLLRMIEAERRAEGNAAEATKIAVVLAETAAWIAELDSREDPPDSPDADGSDAEDGPDTDTLPVHEVPVRFGGSLPRDRRSPGVAWRRTPPRREVLR